MSRNVVSRPPGPAMPPMTPDMSPKDRAKLTLDWLQASLTHAQQCGAPAAELMQYASRITAATNLLAKLSGAFEITHSTILHSKPWADIMAVVRRVWSNHPEALKELLAELETLAGIET